MSLLLDARKKVELALEQSGVHRAIEPQLSETLRLEDSPAGGRDASDSRAAGQNLFAAKAAPANTGRRLGIVPIALISGLVLAAGGGYYVWREISPPPMQRHNPAPLPATPLATATPPAAPVTQAVPTPAAPVKDSSLESKAVTTDASTKQSNHASKVDTPHAPHADATQNAAAQPIHIEHVQDNDAVDPTLLAAYQAYRSADFDTARQHYSEVLRKDAQNHNTPNRDALLGMAAVAQQQSQDAIAARYYNQVLMLDPRDPVANAGMSALLGTSDAAATESRLKLLLAQQPRPTGTQSSALYFALGNLYAEQSRWGDAQQAYFNAYNLEQGNAQFAFNLAVSLDHMGQGKLAAQHYQRALQLDPTDNTGFSREQTQQRINELTAP